MFLIFKSFGTFFFIYYTVLWAQEDDNEKINSKNHGTLLSANVQS